MNQFRDVRKMVADHIAGVGKVVVVVATSVFLTSCTITLTNTSTNGKASDVVDTASTANADISPNIEVPAL